MADLLKIAVVLTAVDQLSGAIRGITQRVGNDLTQLQGKIKGTTDRLEQMGKAARIPGLALTGGAQRAVVAFMDLESAATELQSALMKTGGVVGPEFEQINDLAINLGNTLPGTTADFQAMMTMLMRQGVSANAVLNGMGEAAAYLGVQLKMPPAAAAEFVAKLQDATRTAEKDMLSLVDTIQRTFNLGVDPTNMLGAFGSLGAAMDMIQMKGLQGAKALAPLVAMLDQSGLVGSSAGNALRKLFQAGFDAKKVSDANDVLKQFGVTLSFVNQQGEFAGLDNFFKQLAKFKALSTEARTMAISELWGNDDEVLRALTPLIEKGAAGYAEMSARMREQASIQERIGAQLSTLRNLWEALSGTFTNVLAALGALWGPELKAVTVWLNEMSTRLQQMTGTSAGLFKWVTGLAGGLGLLLLAFAGLTTVLGPAVTGIMAAGKALMGLGALLLANPILAIIAAIAAAALLIYLNWDKVKGFFLNFWAPIQAAWNAFWQFTKTSVGEMIHGIIAGFNSLLSFLGGLASQLYNAGVNLISQLWEGMKAKFAAMKAWLSDSLSNVGSWLIGRSPPPAGPLAKIDIGGANIMAAWLKGMQRVPVGAGVRQIAGRAAGGLGGGRGATISFAPQITITGGGQGVREQVQQGLRVSMREFESLMARYQAQQRRLAYADVG